MTPKKLYGLDKARNVHYADNMTTQTYQIGDRVHTKELIFGRPAPLWIVKARKPYFCDDSNVASHDIAKGDLCASDPYGRVHYCLECVK